MAHYMLLQLLDLKESRGTMNRIMKELPEFADDAPQTIHMVERKSGVGQGVIGQWRRNRFGGNLESVIAVGDFLGYELVWEKKSKNHR